MTRLLYVLCLHLALCSVAFGTQSAIISVEKANVYQGPNVNSPIITTVAPGESVTVSNYHKEGWYRIKTKTGQKGWIWQADLAILQNDPNVKASGLELKGKPHGEHIEHHPQRSLSFTFEGFYFGIDSSNLNSDLGLKSYHIYLTPGGFGEIGIGLTDDLRLALRGGFYRSTNTVSTSAGQYAITQSGMPVLLGLQDTLSHFGSWDITGGIYGGMSLKNVLTVTAVGKSGLNYFRLDGASYAFLLSFAAKYWFTRSFGAVFELGGYYTANKSKIIPNNFSGSGPFLNSNGTLSSLSIQQFGPIISAGLELAF